MVFGLKIWRVNGESMEPLIPAGCFILAAKWLTLFSIKSEQKLIINHPMYGVIVKTVTQVDENGHIWCKGESSESLTTEQLGPINRSQVLGRVIKIFK